MVVGVFQEPGIDLHLPAQDGFQILRHLVPGRNLLVAGGQLAIGRNDTERLLPGERRFAQLVPAVVELALVLVGPFRWHVVRRVRGAGREIDEERLVRRQRLLLADPRHRLVGHVGHEVVALFRRLLHFDRRGPFIKRRIPLVRLAADEPVEILEAAASRGPCIERPDRARLPDRDLVALAELRRAIAVQLERAGDRRGGVGKHGAVAGRAAGDLGDAAHADRVVVASGQQRLAGWRAQRGGVKAIVLQSAGGQSLGGGRLAGTAEGARRTEARVVEQDDQNVGCALWRTQSLDGRVFGVRILGVIGDQAGSRPVWHRKHIAVPLVVRVGHRCFPARRY